MAASCFTSVSISTPSSAHQQLCSTRSNSFAPTTTLPIKSKPEQIRARGPRSKAQLSVQSEYRDGDGKGGSGDFAAGFLLGGAVFGTLAYVSAPQGSSFILHRPSRRRPRSLPLLHALDSSVPHPQGSSTQWDSLTAKFSASANVPFLLLQLPQIILNARNLLSGNKSALLAVPWMGMLTGLLGNLSLLSYFAKKKEKEALVVQTLGVLSTYVVLAQLALAEAMPLPHFIATSVVVAAGLILNLMNYFNLLSSSIWSFWEDFTTVGGLSVLPQVMWSTFVPFIPSSILPGIASFAIAVGLVLMARMGKLSAGGAKFVGAISGWTATLLFMWMPVSQMWTNFLHPDNIRGLSASTMLLAMIGNGLMIPRALFIRDFMWFIGSVWASFLYGYGNIMCLYCFNCISREFFLAATAGLLGWIGMAFWRDSIAYGHGSPLISMKELVFGSGTP